MRITCKTCRRLGQSVCGRENCALKRKPYPPGVHGKGRRRRISEYGKQLAEKQKLKFIYGLREKQFRNYFAKAAKTRGLTGEMLVALLERRLDNVVFRLGFAATRRQARQLVSHGHISVNGRRTTIPSFQVKPGDTIAIREVSRDKKVFGDLAVTIKKHNPPAWLELNKDTFTSTVMSLPAGDELQGVPVEIAQIVEFYSR